MSTFVVHERDLSEVKIGTSSTPLSLLCTLPLFPKRLPTPRHEPQVYHISGYEDFERMMGRPFRRKDTSIRQVEEPVLYMGMYYPTEYVDAYLQGGTRMWARIMNISSVRVGESVTLQRTFNGEWGVLEGYTFVTDKYRSPTFNAKRGPKLRITHELDCYRQYLTSTPLPSMAKRARRPK